MGNDRRFDWYQKCKTPEENSAMLNYIPLQNEYDGYREGTFVSIKAWASCANEKVI